MDDPDIQRMHKQFGVIAAIAEVKQCIEGFGHFAGLQGQRNIPVAIRHN
jgi:hypothetical protein